MGKAFMRSAPLLLIVAMLFAGAPHASAHTLKVDGDVGAILHVDPDDAPVSGSPATFYFQFAEKTGDFDASDYTTTVSLIEGTTTIYSANLFALPGATDDAVSFPYTFATAGAYTVTVVGVPTGSAPPFTLSYDLDVGQGGAAAASSSPSFFAAHGLPVVLAAFLLLALLLIFVERRMRQAKEG